MPRPLDLPFRKALRTRALRVLLPVVVCAPPQALAQAPALDPNDPRLVELREALITVDERWAEIARTWAPGFAGLRSNDDQIVIITSRPDLIASTLEALAALYRAPEFEADVDTFGIQVVRYDFAELYEFARATDDLGWDEFGIAVSGIDEINNRLSFGLQRGGDVGRLREALLLRGIPEDAFYVVAGVTDTPG